MRFLREFAFIGLFSVLVLGQDAPANPEPYSCSASKPCKLGCCGTNNVCGMGPDYCSKDKCIGQCDAKSECDPGWGLQWSSRSKCPLNVCCSKYGFCGITDEFCGTKKVKRPSCSKDSKTTSDRVIGYYEGWGTGRACGAMQPEDMMAGLYTHLNFAFAFINPRTFEVAPMSPGDVDLYPRFTGLKRMYPGLQTWISIGGWTHNDPEQPTAKTFSELAASEANQKKFFKSLVNFMSTYGFDGVDIDWEYPVAEERSGRPEDYKNFISLMKNMKDAMGAGGGKKYGLTLTLPSSYWYMQHFDVKALEGICDWLNIMSYDLHGTWDSSSPWIGPYVNAHTNLTEIDLTLDLLWRNDVAPKNVVLGIGFYGRSFTLTNPSCKTAGCPFSGGGKPGPCTQSAGTLSYQEINDIVKNGARVVEDKVSGAAIVTWDNDQWVSYDNENTLKTKVEYANKYCLGGMMVWAASTDDSSGSAIRTLVKAAGRENIRAELSLWGGGAPKEPILQCVWGECGKGCPSGLQPATDSSGKVSGYAGLFNGCSNDEHRKYCCPTGQIPQCEWRGTAPFCNGKCHDNEVEVSSSTSGTGHGCWTGHKKFCCTSNAATKNQGMCKWFGAAPICTAKAITMTPATWWFSYDCPNDYPKQLTTGKTGYGGEKACLYNGGWKSMCCKDPIPYTNCKWHQGGGRTWDAWSKSFVSSPLFDITGLHQSFYGNDCDGQCPPDQVPIASEGTFCQPGTYSYFCCDNPNSPKLPSPQDAELCAAPKIPTKNSEPDGEDKSNLKESEFFDDDCTLYGLSPANLNKRAIALPWDDDSELADVYEFLAPFSPADTPARIFRRTLDSNGMRFCGPTAGGPDHHPATYPQINSLVRAGVLFVHVAKPLICGDIGLAASKTALKGVKYVVEHVFEKQSLRNILQYLTIGKIAGNKALSFGAAQYYGIFDTASGIFYQNWPANLKPLFGESPMETLYGLLGHTNSGGSGQDIRNLLIVDADLNAYKALITAHSKVISDTMWKSFSELQKFTAIQDVLDTVGYMTRTDTVAAYSSTFNAIYKFWDLFKKIPGVIAGYDWAGAFVEATKADLLAQQSKLLTDMTARIADAQNIWKTGKATLELLYGAATYNTIVKALADFDKDKATLLALKVTDMTKIT